MSENDSNIYTGIIATKLTPPQIRAELVHRKRLLLKFRQPLGKLVLIAAPAGFGKSSLVMDWLSGSERKYAWLSIDESDNDLRRFFTYLIVAIRTVVPGIGEKILPVLKSPAIPASENILTSLINDLQGFPEDITLVMDDYFFIEEQNVHFALNFFLEHLPRNVHIVIATRVDPLLPLHRMRIRNELTEIREKDLRFTREETREFFLNTMHLQLPDATVTALADRTEGWIAGLQMAAISLQDIHDAQNFVRSFTGSNRYIVDYLIEEVLKRQTPEIQNFLLQTSVLTDFNADLCNAVTGRADAAELLQTIERLHLFLVPLDHRREWYRYHHLFGELLRFRLRQIDPKSIDALHLRASEWYENRKDYHRAISQAMKMKSYERAAELLDSYAVTYVARSELSIFLSLIRNIPNDILFRYPGILIIKAWAQLLSHQLEDPDGIIALIERSFESPSSRYTPETIGEGKSHLLVLKSFIHRLFNRYNEAIETSTEALENIPAGYHLEQGLVKFNLGRVYMKLGYIRKAIRYLHECLGDAVQAGNHYVELAALSHIGYLHSLAGSNYIARKKLEDSVVYAERKGLDGLPAMGYIYYQLGRVLYQLNELGSAQEVLDRALELGLMGNEPEVIYNALITSAWVRIALDRPEEALGLFQQAESNEARRQIKAYDSYIATERIHLSVLLGDFDAVGAWVAERTGDAADGVTIVDELEIMLMIRYYLRTEKLDEVERLSAILCRRADEKERTAACLFGKICLSIVLYRRGSTAEGLEKLAFLLGKASEGGFIRGILNMDVDINPMLIAIVGDSAFPEHIREFAAKLNVVREDKNDRSIQTLPKFVQRISEPLTEREQEVLHYLSKDYSNKDIAATMYISLDTVKTHLKNIYGKLGVASRKEAVGEAKGRGLLHPDGDE